MELSYGIERFFLLSYCLACCLPGLGARNDLRVVRQWAELEFVFPDEGARLAAIEHRFYVPGNSVPIDVEVQHRRGMERSRIFVTNPRFDEGRPITLGTVDERGRIAAYPDYSWHDHQGNNCDGLTSVFRVAIDNCQRLWVMDTGKIGDTQHCPPQLLAFGLENDDLIYRHKLDRSTYTENSLFITPVVDVRGLPGDGRDTFVYVADVSGFALVVVDIFHNRSWRVSHRLFFPYPNRGSFVIDGESFDLMDGVIGMALSPISPTTGDRFLYFHALASTTENFILTSQIRNDSFVSDSNADPKEIKAFPDERPSQSAAEAMDRNGILYFGLMDPPSIWCWNSATEYTARNFHQVALDRETLQFASGVKVIDNLKGEQELWILTSSFQRVMTGTLSSNRTNFRIHAEKIPHILRGSSCLQTPKDRYHGFHANKIMPYPVSRGYYKYGALSFL